MKDDKVPLKAVLQEFITHVENLEARLKENDDLYEREFQELKNISDSLKSQKYYACTQGEKAVNRRKNRYKDILPFDVSRVVLSKIPGVVGSDYINANYVRGASGSTAYIASQGPLPHTVADFWRMAIECEVQVIVMACNQTEAGKNKCESYLPEHEGSEQTYGDVAVTLSHRRRVCPDFTVKKLTVRYTGASGSREERLVCQFHYSAWPDHSVPGSAVPLLHMIRLLRDTQASETLPVLVHCSAGCGRTGTVCAIDYVWGLLKAGKLTPAFSLFDLVAEMRRQRIAMVQTKDQYMLVHRAVRQLFADQLRVIEAHPYANVNSAGKVLASADTGDYEVICPRQEVLPSTQERAPASPPPQVKPPPRKNAPRHRYAAPPLPHKRRLPLPESKAAGAVSRNLSAQYQGSLDRAEIGRRNSVGRLRQMFEGGGLAAPAAAKLCRSRSSAALGRPLGSDRTAASLIPPPQPPDSVQALPTASRVTFPPRMRSVSRKTSPPQVRVVPRSSSPSPVRLATRAQGSPPSRAAVDGASVSALVLRVAGQEGSLPCESVPSPHRRPALPMKRSKSLKLPAAAPRVQQSGPAYLALEDRMTAPVLATTGTSRPLYANMLPSRSANIDLLRRYEAELEERSRELGLDDPLTEPPPFTDHRNCMPEARRRLRRIEAQLQHSQHSRFQDTVGEPAAGCLGGHARQRRNSFRQAVKGRETYIVSSYEPIWVEGERRSPTTQPSSLPLNVTPAGSSWPVDSRPRPVGNSLFWSAELGTEPTPVPKPGLESHGITSNSVSHDGLVPSRLARSISLSVSANSAFRPYQSDMADSPVHAAVCKQTKGGGSGSPSCRDGAVAERSERGPVAPPRRRAGSGGAVSQHQLLDPSHLFLADVEPDGGVSDTDSLPPAIPVKTQAAYHVPRPADTSDAGGEGAASQSLSLRPERLRSGDRAVVSSLYSRAKPPPATANQRDRQAYV